MADEDKRPRDLMVPWGRDGEDLSHSSLSAHASLATGPVWDPGLSAMGLHDLWGPPLSALQNRLLAVGQGGLKAGVLHCSEAAFCSYCFSLSPELGPSKLLPAAPLFHCILELLWQLFPSPSAQVPLSSLQSFISGLMVQPSVMSLESFHPAGSHKQNQFYSESRARTDGTPF